MAKKKVMKSKVKLGTMTIKYTGKLPVVEDTLEQLEKKLDLASARLTYALEQKKNLGTALLSAFL